MNQPYVRDKMGPLPKSEPRFMGFYMRERMLYPTRIPNREMRRRIAKGRDPWTGYKRHG